MSTSPTSSEATALLLESRRLCVEEYRRMFEVGILDEDERVELLEGVIVAMSPQSGSHARCIQWLTHFLVRTIGGEHIVRVQLPLTLGERSEPEPDLAVVAAAVASQDPHPSEAVLVIEVAGRSLRLDRKVKAKVYARSGIPEYWIVDVEARQIEVYTDPDIATGSYRRTRTVTAPETLVSEALPQISSPVAEVFG